MPNKRNDILQSVFKIKHRFDDTGIPGFCTIEGKTDNLNEKGTDVISFYISVLCKGLHALSTCVIGIYWEWSSKDEFSIHMIPFYIDVLDRLSIPYEPYQPRISYYLNNFPEGAEYKALQEKLRSYIEENKDKSLVSEEFSEETDKNEGAAEPVYRPEPLSPTFEVLFLDEIPNPPAGKKYYPCIGGGLNYQVFMEDNKLSRGDFMRIHENDIEWFLRPLKLSSRIFLRQDAKYAIPGFLILSPQKEYHYVSDMPRMLFAENIQKAIKVRNFLLSFEDIKSVYIYYDEHYKKPSSVHFWVLPIYESCFGTPSILDQSVWTYMDTFEYRKNKDKIVEIRRTIEERINELQ